MNFDGIAPEFGSARAGESLRFDANTSLSAKLVPAASLLELVASGVIEQPDGISLSAPGQPPSGASPNTMLTTWKR